MKFIIDNTSNEDLAPIITIDIKPYEELDRLVTDTVPIIELNEQDRNYIIGIPILRKAVEIALELEGHDEKAIDTIFGRESVTSATRCGVISTEITSLVAEYNGNLTNKQDV